MDFNFNIHVYMHKGRPEHDHELRALKREIHKMAQNLDELTAAVAAEATVIDSAVALINGFAAKLEAAQADPAALAALVSELKSNSSDLAAAVAANTPAAEEAPAEEEPAEEAPPVEEVPAEEEAPIEEEPEDEGTQGFRSRRNR